MVATIVVHARSRKICNSAPSVVVGSRAQRSGRPLRRHPGGRQRTHGTGRRDRDCRSRRRGRGLDRTAPRTSRLRTRPWRGTESRRAWCSHRSAGCPSTRRRTRSRRAAVGFVQYRRASGAPSAEASAGPSSPPIVRPASDEPSDEVGASDAARASLMASGCSAAAGPLVFELRNRKERRRRREETCKASKGCRMGLARLAPETRSGLSHNWTTRPLDIGFRPPHTRAASPRAGPTG